MKLESVFTVDQDLSYQRELCYKKVFFFLMFIVVFFLGVRLITAGSLSPEMFSIVFVS